MANKNGQMTLSAAVDVDALGVISVDELIDLSTVVEPLIEIDTYLGQDVILHHAKPMIAPDGNKYLILDVQSVQTGNRWKSSCSHWFMFEVIKKIEEKGLPPFPMAVNFYKDGKSIKFEGIEKKNKTMLKKREGNSDIPF